MKAQMEVATGLATAGNIVPLPAASKPQPQAKKARTIPERFKLSTYVNPRTDSESYRVSGIKRDGTRIRENFQDLLKAQARQSELNTEYLQGHVEQAIRATRLTDEQIAIAEACFHRLAAPKELVLAVDNWLRVGRQASVAETKSIDDAFEAFKTWMDKQPANELSHQTKKNLRNRVNLFLQSHKNILVSDITTDAVDAFLAARAVSRQTRTNDRLALSRFFGWCKLQKWTTTNPARKEVKSRRPARPEPKVLKPEQAQRLLKEAEAFKKGRLAPYVAVCIFGALRPTEAAKLTWDKVNLKDGELTVTSHNPLKRGRVIEICPTLKAWLEKYEGKPFFPKNWRKDFDEVRSQAGFGDPEKGQTEWPEDVMRHTGISAYFRRTGSFGLTAEWAGNSEQVIKNHYLSKLSKEEAAQIWAIKPGKKGGRK